MKKRRSAEQIVGLLRQADVDLRKGATVPDVCRQLARPSWRLLLSQSVAVAGDCHGDVLV